MRVRVILLALAVALVPTALRAPCIPPPTLPEQISELERRADDTEVLLLRVERALNAKAVRR